jgi:hypothetical protein
MQHPTRLHACTIQKVNGEFCLAPSVPGSPHPICVKHLGILHGFAKQMLDLHAGTPVPPPNPTAGYPTPIPVGVVPNGEGVYYLRCNSLIKIGCSQNLPKRIANYPAGTPVLAVERGGYKMEQRRLTRFAEARAIRREYFHPAPELLAHINQIRKAAGAPFYDWFASAA